MKSQFTRVIPLDTNRKEDLNTHIDKVGRNMSDRMKAALITMAWIIAILGSLALLSKYCEHKNESYCNEIVNEKGIK
jgi:hypothetical protein